ncbi:MAG TPA: hypothetical protein VMB21_06695, partial [Candidatus Limnocylindria bacterium]|nr:hypothetical protein [Candidatus Limnocylindria bacterium]
MKTFSRARVLAFLAVGGVMLILLFLAIRAAQPATVEVASLHPVWTAQITGTTGDVAQIWVWTQNATLRTNLVIPAELRLEQRGLLLQVKSAGNLVLNLNVAGTNLGSARVTINERETNSAEFLSRFPYPFLPLGGF